MRVLGTVAFNTKYSGHSGPEDRRVLLRTESPIVLPGSLGGALTGSSPGQDGRVVAVRQAKLRCRRSVAGIAKMTRPGDAWLALGGGCYAFVM